MDTTLWFVTKGLCALCPANGNLWVPMQVPVPAKKAQPPRLCFPCASAVWR